MLINGSETYAPYRRQYSSGSTSYLPGVISPNLGIDSAVKIGGKTVYNGRKGTKWQFQPWDLTNALVLASQILTTGDLNKSVRDTFEGAQFANVDLGKSVNKYYSYKGPVGPGPGGNFAFDIARKSLDFARAAQIRNVAPINIGPTVQSQSPIIYGGGTPTSRRPRRRQVGPTYGQYGKKRSSYGGSVQKKYRRTTSRAYNSRRRSRR